VAGAEPSVEERRRLAKLDAMRTGRWPRTERRLARIDQVLGRRQPDLTVVLENVHDPHNVSAVLRSCDAVGVFNVHTIYTVEEPPAAAFARTTSASAAKWIEVVQHVSISACYQELRQQGMAIVATSVQPGSVDLYEHDLSGPTALVFGNEMRGISGEAAALADRLLAIPMVGMVQSLNISVACAVVLYEALRQRRDKGMYEEARLTRRELDDLRNDWLTR
jgi:tRNA (guanosine-2'-O-)-methyltransferase